MVDTSRLLESVSPTRYEQLRLCPLRVAFAQSGKRVSSLQADQLLIGEVVHGSIELLARREHDVVADAWEVAANKVDLENRSSVRELAGTRRAMLRLQRRWGDLKSVLLHSEVSELIIEQRFESLEKAVEGRPDVVVVSGDTAHVVDYKSGIVSGDEGVKSFYERQLRIYAALVAEALPVNDVRASLFSLRQGFIEVDVFPELREKEITELRTARERYNSQVPGPQPANPSTVACAQCAAIVNCDAFWGAIDPDWSEDEAFRFAGTFAEGSVLLEPEVSLRAEYGLSLELESGNLSGEQPVIVAGVPIDQVGTLGPGDRLRLGGLMLKRSGSLAWTPTSTSLVLSNGC